ncbi:MULTISPECIES: hypothetical protein [unclassified Rhizobium]|uniref:hypothetical protein n=1 Tax=unclassified Rhizobium TaxID=2613769 RepID=UPI001ADC375F|nr:MULTISPECIES: hypothetical protein [unclassified Rhizobium]MBO9126143.1 hypothetical protein [Rhizobium sp. 16-488-2b]MBO9176727.1 hypothetical protein [Rhizobium sp. 16-488-2a]
MSDQDKSQVSSPTELVEAFDDIAQGLAELDRGESTDLDEVLEKARAIVVAAERRHGHPLAQHKAIDGNA